MRGLRGRSALQQVQLAEDREIGGTRLLREEVRTLAEPDDQLVEAPAELRGEDVQGEAESRCAP
jgi:hypothetical protein